MRKGGFEPPRRATSVKRGRLFFSVVVRGRSGCRFREKSAQSCTSPRGLTQHKPSVRSSCSTRTESLHVCVQASPTPVTRRYTWNSPPRAERRKTGNAVRADPQNCNRYFYSVFRRSCRIAARHHGTFSPNPNSYKSAIFVRTAHVKNSLRIRAIGRIRVDEALAEECFLLDEPGADIRRREEAYAELTRGRGS